MVSLVWTAFWNAKPCKHNKIFILRFKPIILLFFFFSPIYWDCEALCPTYSTLGSAVFVSGAMHEKGTEVLWRPGGGWGGGGGVCTAYEITDRNNGIPAPNRTLHTEPTSCKQDSASGKMLVQILIYHSLFLSGLLKHTKARIVFHCCNISCFISVHADL